MATMANADDAILKHYKIDSLFPKEWPADKDDEDEDDDSDEDKPAKDYDIAGVSAAMLAAPGIAAVSGRRAMARSRYSVLEPQRASVPGAQRTKDGLENLVQNDEADPLGGPLSTLTILSQQGVTDVETDASVRAKYFLSSTTYSARLHVSKAYTNASIDELRQGAGFLSQSIDKKSASLKVLVESNFEKFVRAKTTIDNVYREMKNPGHDQDADDSQPFSATTHSRKTSRQNAANLQRKSTAHTARRKNALVKEQEYGVLAVKQPLSQLLVKAEEVWGPALGKRERETHLTLFREHIAQHKAILQVPASVADAIKRRDHEALIEVYARARRMVEDVRNMTQAAAAAAAHSFSEHKDDYLSDSQKFQIMAVGKMWSDVQDQIGLFKRDLWGRLSTTHSSAKQSHAKHANASAQGGGRSEEHMELIKALLELGVNDNPIWIWLFGEYGYLKEKITHTFDRAKVEIEILRRQLGQGDKPTPWQVAGHFKAATLDGRVGADAQIDLPRVIKVWEHIYSSLNNLVSAQGGILAEVIEFWETTKSFISGSAQKALPAGLDGSSRKHHRLSAEGVSIISVGAQGLVDMIRLNLLAFFIEPPVQDLSLLLTPTASVPPTPRTPKTPPKSSTLSSFGGDARLRIDPNSLPPPASSSSAAASSSAGKPEAWAKYAFWPPQANSLSGVHYLSRILSLVGAAACEMASLEIIESRQDSMVVFRQLLTSVRDRCVEAACAAWAADCNHIMVLEDWSRTPDRHDITNFPSQLMLFQGFLLQNFQRILSVPEAMRNRGNVSSNHASSSASSSDSVSQVQLQFVTSIYKVIDLMTDHAEAVSTQDDDSTLDTSITTRLSSNHNQRSVIVPKRNVRILLTLSNIQLLKNDIMPHLLAMFESHFTIKLDDESPAIRDALEQIDDRLFQAYVSPLVQQAHQLICSSIAQAEWVPRGKPTNARPYIYTLLMGLVIVHSQLTTTAAPLTTSILTYLFERYLRSFIESFASRKSYNQSALLQATLDVEFFSQTLSRYMTKDPVGAHGGSHAQPVLGRSLADGPIIAHGLIYETLDALTEAAARTDLKQVLQELRVTLNEKKYTTRIEFACFRTRRRSNTKTRGDEARAVVSPTSPTNGL